jgi:subtilisin family serine protease
MVTGYLPVSALLSLDQLPHFHSATPVYRPILRTFESEGDAVILAPPFRASQGVDGTGIKVGVLSDSVNQVANPANAAQVGIAWSQSFGELLGGVQVLEDLVPHPGTDEGRAMLEIVNDVAPGSPLAFHTAAISPQDFAGGIQALAAAGCKVIVDDIGYSNDPFFNDGVVSQAVDAVKARGVTYVSAAGNDANHGYLANWKSITATVGTVTSTFHDIGGGSPLQTFSLAQNESIGVSVDWDAAFLEGGATGHGVGNFKVNNDVEVLITNAAGTQVFKTFDPNATSNNEANALVNFTNDGTFGTNNFAMAFHLKSGAAPTMIRWVQFGGTTDPNALAEGASTIYGHTAARGAIAVAAANWATPTQPESFTALGGDLPILFNSNGVRLAQVELRRKPEVTGPDGVHTTFFGDDDGSGGFTFSGTSAAAPHVAGAAALLLQQAPGATPDDIKQHLEATARDIFTPGFDFLTGFGLVQLAPLNIGPAFNGDANESNQTSDTATNFGTLSTSTSFTNMGIDELSSGLSDYDWYRWSAGRAGTLTVTFSVTQGGPLELHLFTVQGNTLVELNQTSTGPLVTPVTAGEPILVEVKGINTSPGVKSLGTYDMRVSLT